MLLCGKLAKMMLRIDPALYREYIKYDAKGIPLLYVRLNKALYGMLRAALLFYKRLRRWLEDTGFKVNPYDPCVANKIINGTQMSICWHVDDLKVSHKEEDVVTTFAVAMGKEFGSGTTTKRGKVFDYLGIELDSKTCPGTMIVSMIKYPQKIIQEFPEVLKQLQPVLRQIIYSQFAKKKKIENSSAKKWLNSSTGPQRSFCFYANKLGLMLKHLFLS